MIWKTVHSATLGALILLTSTAARGEEKASFHHAHLNVTNTARTITHYRKFYSAVPIKFRNVSDALLTDRSFLLLTKVADPAPSKMESAIYHLGWGGVDGPSEFEWRDKLGMKWETPLSSLGENWFMYAYGPDNEVSEIWTGFKHNRFGHVHLFSEDVGKATEWYVENLGLTGPSRISPRPEPAPRGFNANDPENQLAVFRYLWASQVATDNGVTINIFAKPHEDTVNWWNYEGIDELVPSDGRVIDHIAFSYPDIDPVFDRMEESDVEIVKKISFKADYGMKSFFIRGPDSILIEIVEALPFPQGLWNGLNDSGDIN